MKFQSDDTSFFWILDTLKYIIDKKENKIKSLLEGIQKIRNEGKKEKETIQIFFF